MNRLSHKVVGPETRDSGDRGGGRPPQAGSTMSLAEAQAIGRTFVEEYKKTPPKVKVRGACAG